MIRFRQSEAKLQP